VLQTIDDARVKPLKRLVEQFSIAAATQSKIAPKVADND
jgi:hypothetical protein